MYTVSNFCMQSHQPLLLHRRAASVAALRMLSSSSSSTFSTNPNPNPNSTLTTMSKPTSESPLNPQKINLFAESANTLFNSRSIKCFCSSKNHVPVNGSGEEECSLVVVSFYKFADFPDHADLRKPLKELCERLRVSGGIILAPEGINGSICGTRDSVEEVLTFIQSDERLKRLRRIESPVSPEEEAIHHGHMSSSPLAAGEDAPFRWDHVRVKLKKEIVTLGMPSVSPIERVGEYVSPKEWNDLISDPDTVVIDVRNDYETRIGKFKRAVDPCTTAFRKFPSWVDEQFKLNEAENLVETASGTETTTTEQNGETEKKMPRVAMYCTGGIRCEKASSLLLSKGFNEVVRWTWKREEVSGCELFCWEVDKVYHLKGGILKYLEEVPKAESLWEGECFVFDKRVSVEHGLVQGTYKLCYGCKQPVSDADMEAPEWEYAVCCPYCYSSKSEEEKERARARQRQFEMWGIIGGPDKGRRPIQKAENEEKSVEQIPSSI